MKINFLVTLTIFLLVLLSINMLLFANSYSTNKRELIDESKVLLENINERLLIDIEDVKSDLLYLTNKSVDVSNTNVLKEDFLRFAKHKKRYDQLRLIDLQGTERIRINYNQGHPSVVEQQELQNKKHRYYFLETIQLQYNDVYISPLDLNIERNQVELPLKPMIRFVSPVLDLTRKKVGIIVLNYLAEETLSRFRDITHGFQGHVLLLNENGYYLVGLNREDEWGFMFPDKGDYTFGQFDPDAWKVIQNEKFGDYESGKRVISFSTLNLTNFINNADETVQHKARYWKIVSLIPHELLWQKSIKRLQNQLPLNALLLIFASLSLWLFFTNTRKRRKHEEEIESLHRAIASERELFIEGPTVVLAFKNAYGWPVSFVSQNVETVFGYQSCQFEEGKLDLASIIAPDFLESFSNCITLAIRENRLHFEHPPFKVVKHDAERTWVQDSISIVKDDEGNVTGFLGYFNDVSLMKEAEARAQKAGEFVQTVVDSIADPTLVIDASNYKIILSNQAANDTYTQKGRTAEMTCYQMTHARGTPCDDTGEPCPVKMVLATKKVSRVVHKHYAGNGSSLYVELVATPILDDNGHVIQVIESHRDISHHVALEQELKHLASIDKLTQAYNRTKFDDELQKQVGKAQRYSISLGIIMFDIDHFKRVNDTYGHDVGDKVLIEIVQLVKKNIRSNDFLARWGGEEFMILIPQTNEVSLNVMMENLRRNIEQYPFSGVGTITTSFGATLICEEDTIESLTKRVDKALYQSKADGRNRTTIILPT